MRISLTEDAGQLIIKVGFGMLLAIVAWTVVASEAFLLGTGLFHYFSHPFWQWWLYAMNTEGNPTTILWLKISAGVGGVPVVGMALLLVATGRKVVGPKLRRRLFGGKVTPSKAVTDNHGHAQWMTLDRAKKRFPGPDAEFGGIVVGEAYRVDQDKMADMPFDPKDPKTWGQGGKAPLLIDPCHIGPTHTMLITGSGGYKTTTAISTLLYWTGAAVILDPSGELSPMLTRVRQEMGHKVYDLEPGGSTGFNILDWIDITSPLADTNIDAVISWICGEKKTSGNDSKDFFDSQGRAVITCLLAHVLFSPDVPKEGKTLKTLREGISVPGPQLRKALQAIYETSPSSYARELAGPLYGVVNETFDGIVTNAGDQTKWLANPAFANLVSGDTFTTHELLNGKVTIFLKMPLKVLDATPGVARAIIGALLNAAYEADGNVAGRILFLLDEVARLGRMSILSVARDAGRKYGITLQLLYQSPGQIIDQWGEEGKKAWYDSVSWRAYTGVQDPETARELEETFGTYGVMATSEGTNKGSSGKGFGEASQSRGSNTSYHEIGRPLIRKSELMQDVRDDELFVVSRSAPPLRCGRAIYFRRPEMVQRVGKNRFFKAR